MTRADRPVTRRTRAQFQRRELVVTIDNHFIRLREFGRRKVLEVPLAMVADLAYKIEAREKRAAKKAGRKAA